MSRRANPVAVGSFVLVAIALAVGGLIVLGGGRLFAESERYSVFFEGSVNGLTVGSPVKLRGVPIGEVVSIQAIVDERNWETAVETVIEVRTDRFERIGIDDEITHEQLIEQGLRARPEIQSFLTGQLYVQLSFQPETEVQRTKFPPKYPEIPAIPTAVEKMAAMVRKFVERLEELPLEDMLANLNSALDGADRLVHDPNIPKALENLDLALVEARGALSQLQDLARNVDGQVAPLSESAIATLENARHVTEELRDTISSGSPIMFQVAVTLQELERTIQAVRSLVQAIERDPRSLLFGPTVREE